MFLRHIYLSSLNRFQKQFIEPQALENISNFCFMEFMSKSYILHIFNIVSALEKGKVIN